MEKTMRYFFESIDTGLIEPEALPWTPFLPYTDRVYVKLIKVDPIRGEWITLLKAPAGFELPRHHHSGTVHVYTLQGEWRYKEHNWVAKAGTFVFETAGTEHTPVAVGKDDVITLNIVQGDWIVIDEAGKPLAIETWKTAMQRYLDHCDRHRIEPVDVSSLSA